MAEDPTFRMLASRERRETSIALTSTETEVPGNGVAGGPGVEVVLATPGAPGVFQHLAYRLIGKVVFDHVTGASVSRADMGVLGGFGFTPTESRDAKISSTVYTLGGDLIGTFVNRHVDLYTGVRYRRVFVDTTITENGTVPFIGSVTRQVREKTRGDQWYTPIGVEARVGGWYAPLAPLAGRLELQIGPDSFGVFVKVGWMFGAGGSWSPLEYLAGRGVTPWPRQ